MKPMAITELKLSMGMELSSLKLGTFPPWVKKCTVLHASISSATPTTKNQEKFGPRYRFVNPQNDQVPQGLPDSFIASAYAGF